MKIDFLKGIDIEKTDANTVEMLKKMGQEVEKAFDAFLGESIDKKGLEEKLSEVVKNLDSKEELKALKDQLKEMKGAMVLLKGKMEKSDSGEFQLKSIEKQVEDQLKEFITTDKTGRKTIDMKSACKAAPGYKKTLNIVIDTKAAATTITSASVAPHFSHTVDNVLSVEPRANTILRQYANVSPVGTRSLTYAQFVSVNGDAAWVPEDGAKPMIDGTLEEVTINAAKVACGAKLTEETLTDLPQLVAEIRAEIINKIGLKEEAGILTGTGTGGEIKGVQSELPAFNLTSVKIKTPGIVDAIVAAYTQVINNSEQSYIPNVVMINPVDWANMAREKDSTGRPLNERISEVLPTGLNVVTSTAIAQGTFILGDFAYLNIRDYMVLTITIGWENDDFTKNLVTLIGEKRLMCYIKKQYKSAFVKDTWANVITAITKP